MQVETFVTVAQRRVLTIDDSLLPVFGPLFQIETHMSMEERVRLTTTALKLPHGFSACEVGSYVGASACFLAAAASLKSGHVHCVDVWDNRAMGLEPPRDTFAEFSTNTAQFSRWITVHRGESAALAARVPDALDLLFIDGDHSHGAVLADLRSYVPRLKPGALLLLHDFTYPTVRGACMEFGIADTFLDAGSVHSLQVFQKRG